MEASWAELVELWNGDSSPSADELAERRSARMSLTFHDAPPFLGPPPSPIPEIEGLPPEVLRMNRAQATLSQVLGQRAPSDDGEDLVGAVANSGEYEGIARVAVGDYAFERIKTGDELRLITSDATLSNLTTGEEFQLNELGEIEGILKAGGLFAYARQNHLTVELEPGS